MKSKVCLSHAGGLIRLRLFLESVHSAIVLDCKTVRIFAYSSAQEQSKVRSLNPEEGGGDSAYERGGDAGRRF